MSMADWRLLLARVMMVGAFACGIVGLVIGIVEREWRLGVTGWFTGGTLLAVLAIAVLADRYFELRRQ
ncbi:MAG: hypothetical protein J4F46_01050 [Dehalococcoidia bacterium]|nr:hypothetical protein [Dehalococcoidia bacterium]